ncbi:hypothetical protein ACWGJ9_09540 [Curtobacterium citreum]
MPTTRKPRPLKLFRYEPVSTRPVLRAADIVTAALKLTGTSDIDTLIGELREPESVTATKLKPIQFTDDQLNLIDRYAGHMRLLRNKPTVAINECPTCGMVWAATAKQSKCTLTRDCDGVPAKSATAKKVPL